MAYHPSNPLIAQSDKTVLLEVNNPLYEEARDALARFAELEKSPEHIHTYRITPPLAVERRRGRARCGIHRWRPRALRQIRAAGQRARGYRRRGRTLRAG